METRRCFIAVNLPQKLKEEIFSMFSKKIPEKECKLAGKENLHFTVVFLGNISPESIGQAREKIKAVEKIKKFELEISGAGHFNHRVFWLGTKKGKEALEEIAKALAKEFNVQEENFSAHLTVARNKSLGKKEAEDLVKALAGENFSRSFEVESVDFMESMLSGNGPEYKKIFSEKLQ